jgi:tetratricopeptide (TPR) repeat protein
MDRTALAICAGILCPLGAVLKLGCNAQPASPGATAQSVETLALRQLPLADAASWKQLDTRLFETNSNLAKASELPDADEADEPASPTELTFAAPALKSHAINNPSDEPVSADDDEGRRNQLPGEQPLAEAEPLPDSDAATAPVAGRADQRVRRGFQLAGRGALYSARAEFVAALQLIAQANDAQQNTQLYGKALTAGVVALKESADFVRQNTAHPNIDAARIVAGHKTPILKAAPAARLTPMFAAQSYYNFVQEQLAGAAAQDPGSSMALYGLGKIAIASASANKTRQLEYTAQAMALCQAALMADPNNFRAANDLAVLLAENGSLQKARELLIRSVTLSSQAATWQNLAAVHSRLGEEQLAEQARQKALAMPRGRDPWSTAVEWVDPATFARAVSPSDGLVPEPAANPKAPQAQRDPAEPAKSMAKKGIFDRLPKYPWR